MELVEEGDWIAGTGGKDVAKSAGHGKVIFAMRVDEKIPLCEYCEGNQDNRIDADFDIAVDDRFALISYHYFYFGRNAVDVSDIPRTHLDHPFEKAGPGHRSDFTEDFVEQFALWLKSGFKVGVHGPPCKPHPALKLPISRSTATEGRPQRLQGYRPRRERGRG